MRLQIKPRGGIFRWIFGPLIDIDITTIGIFFHCSQCCPNDLSKKGEIKLMFIEDATREPVPFHVEVVGITDSEGNPVDKSEVKTEAKSSDESVIGVTFDEASGDGQVSFGATGESLFSVTTVDKDDPEQVLATYAVGFRLVAGNPEAVTAVEVTFDGIEEVEPEPPVVDNTLPATEGQPKRR